MNVKILIVILFAIISMATLGNNLVTSFQFITAQNDQRFIAILTPKEVIPSVDSQATGIAEFTVVGGTIKYTVNASDIHGATTSHIHLGAPGTNGLDLATLFDNPAPSSNDKVIETGVLTKESGLFEYITDLTTPMMDGDLYVDVHTTQNPDGEILGQITEVK